jgi:negative regulator of flagellin synthesis FlgM
MQISGNFSVTGVDAARSAAKTNVPGSASTHAPPKELAPSDQLDLSPEALSVGNSDPSNQGIRTDKVESLRAAIAQGNYDTEAKLSAAIDSFLDQLG